MNTITTPAFNASKKPKTPSSQESHDSISTDPSKYGAIAADRIRARAYELYLARNGKGTPGNAMADWLQAERELNGGASDPSASVCIEAKSAARGEKLLASGS